MRDYAKLAADLPAGARRFALVGLPALGLELRRAVGEAEILAETGSDKFLGKVGLVARLVGVIRRRGGDPRRQGVEMSSLDVLERQVESLIAQAVTAREMIRELKTGVAQPSAGPDLRVVKPPPQDPIQALRLEISHHVAQGRSWDQLIDLVDRDLVLAAQKQYTEFGPGRTGPGRRDPSGFRKHVMAGVATPEQASKAVA